MIVMAYEHRESLPLIDSIDRNKNKKRVQNINNVINNLIGIDFRSYKESFSRKGTGFDGFKNKIIFLIFKHNPQPVIIL